MIPGHLLGRLSDATAPLLALAVMLATAVMLPALAYAEEEPATGRTDDPPPWAVESPRGAGAWLGVGADYRWEELEELEITSSRTVVTLLGPQGEPQTSVIDGDPALLNRKFDLGWKLAAPGLQVPLGLPVTRVGRRLALFPTLVLEVAAANADFSAIDRSPEAASSFLAGDGELFGIGADLVAARCRSCRWFAGLGYRFRTLPAFRVKSAPDPQTGGVQRLDDDTRLAWQRHEVTARVGRRLSGGRVAPYLGARGRWSEVEIEDELRLLSSDGAVTDFRSRTRLEEQAVAGLVGLDAHLGGRTFARAEASFGEGGEEALLKVTRLWGNRVSLAAGPAAGEDGVSREEARRRARAEQIAAEIAPALAALEAEFLARWRRLSIGAGPRGEPAYRRDEVVALLGWTETQLLLILRPPELAALRASVLDLFAEARLDLGLPADAGGGDVPPAGTSRSAVFAPATGIPRLGGVILRAQASGSWLDRGLADRVLGSICRFLCSQRQRAEAQRISLLLTFRAPAGVELVLAPKYLEARKRRIAPETPTTVFLGTYSFEVEDKRRRPVDRVWHCDALAGGPDAPCPLDLVNNPTPELTCREEPWSCTVQERLDIDAECPHCER